MRTLHPIALIFASMVLPAQQSSKTLREDYYHVVNAHYRVWSLLDARWYEYSVKDPNGVGGGVDGSWIKGSRLLRPGHVETYQVFFSSEYQGQPKERWQWRPGQEQPSPIGTIYTEDEVQVAWEVRASKGLKLLSEPMAPRGTLRYGEPYATTFRVRLEDSKADPEPKLELYVCLYHDGKLVNAYFSIMTLNDQTAVEPDQENEYMRRRYGKVSEEIIGRYRKWSEERHCDAPGPEEVWTATNAAAPIRRPSGSPK